MKYNIVGEREERVAVIKKTTKEKAEKIDQVFKAPLERIWICG